MKRTLAFALVSLATLAFTCLSADADVPVLTSSLEYVGNPAKNRWPKDADSYYRGALDLQFHRGALLVGSGEVETNPGPIHIYSTDPVTLQQKYEYSAGTEAISGSRVASWGELLVPSQDPHEKDPTVADVYIRGTNGAWRRHIGVNDDVPYKMTSTTGSVWSSTHVWDMEEFDGRIFTASYQLHWSTNRCVSFVNTGSITNAYRLFDYMAADGKRYRMWSLRRQMQLMRFESDLWAVPLSVVQPNYSVSDSNQYYNKLEVFHYNSSTKKFDEGRIPLSSLFPSISSNDFRLVLSAAGASPFDPLPTGKYDYLRVRLWHTTPFKGRVLYVGSYDTTQGNPALTSYPLPLMGCSAYMQTSGGKKTLKATRLSFDGDKEEYPWDFVVVGDTVYALTSKPNATTKVVRHSVWKSTDGVSFSRVLSFDFHQNMISLDYRDGWFWFGVGVKNATKGYAYDSKKDEAGAIYRVRLPQEPTSVEAVNPPATIEEGGTTAVSFRLTAQPASNLVLRVAARASQNVTLDKSSLTFTTSNWSTPQTVTVSLADDDVPDETPIVVTCGVDSQDIERGDFISAEVTSAPVVLSPIEDDYPILVNYESSVATITSLAYRVSIASFGAYAGEAATSASVSVSVYTNAALTALAGETRGTIAATGATNTFAVAGLRRGERYWLVARVVSLPQVVRTFTADRTLPIADAADLVNLLQDESNRGTVTSNAKSDAQPPNAYDNKTTKFGGYSLPVYLTYQFKTAQVVNGIGVKSIANGEASQHPTSIKLYGSNTTNNFELIFSRTGETGWSFSEWRRWIVANTNAYSYYKITISCSAKPCFVQELALYGLDLGEPAVVVPQPEFSTGGAPAPRFDGQGSFVVSIGNAVKGGRYRVYATESLSEPFKPVGEIVVASADGVLDFAVETAGKPSLFIKVGSAE